MWIYHKGERANPLEEVALLRIGQLSYMPRPLPWLTFPHIHPREYELSYILSGQGKLHLPGRECTLERGTIALVPPRTAHYFTSESDQDMSYYALRILGGEEDRAAAELLGPYGCVVARGEQVDQLRALLDAMADISTGNGGIIGPAVQIIGRAVWELTAQDLARSGEGIVLKVPEYANDILCYLQEHVHEKITLEDLARRFSLSPSHLSRVFRRAYGVAPIDYLIRSRMGRARTYILNDGLPAEEIAKRLSYSSTYQFTKAFTRFFGCPPEDYMARAKEQEEPQH